MKKLLLLALFVVSPLIGQETRHKKDVYLEYGAFTRVEGISKVPAEGDNLKSDAISLTALEFSVGKDNIYFYSQLRFSSTLPTYRHIQNVSLSGFGTYYGRRIGFLVGLGGEIFDNRPDQDSQKFTMTMNFGVGADFTLDKVLNDIPITATGLPTILRDYRLNNYLTIEWNWMMKYQLHKHFGIQWGFNLALSSDLDQNTRPDFINDPFVSLDPSELILMRYGFSLGFVF